MMLPARSASEGWEGVTFIPAPRSRFGLVIRYPFVPGSGW